MEIVKALQNAKASLELEGFVVSEEDENLVMAVLENQISQEEFLVKALEMAKGV